MPNKQSATFLQSVGETRDPSGPTVKTTVLHGRHKLWINEADEVHQNYLETYSQRVEVCTIVVSI